MNKICIGGLVGVVGLAIGVYFLLYNNESPVEESQVSEQLTMDLAGNTEFTERYSARVDRVDVVFEHKDYTWYQLTTNGLVRQGDLNTERGYEDDVDATVYVLNWQNPVGEQMAYVRLTNEPGRLYLLDSERKIITGSVMMLEENN